MSIHCKNYDLGLSSKNLLRHFNFIIWNWSMVMHQLCNITLKIKNKLYDNFL